MVLDEDVGCACVSVHVCVCERVWVLQCCSTQRKSSTLLTERLWHKFQLTHGSVRSRLSNCCSLPVQTNGACEPECRAEEGEGPAQAHSLIVWVNHSFEMNSRVRQIRNWSSNVLVFTNQQSKPQRYSAGVNRCQCWYTNVSITNRQCICIILVDDSSWNDYLIKSYSATVLIID